MQLLSYQCKNILHIFKDKVQSYNNYNVKKIILDYMKIDISTVAPKNTTSQQRFKDIRNLLK